MALWRDGLHLRRSIPGAGVYDVAWSKQGAVACACADGELRLHSREQDLGGCKLTEGILTHLCWLNEKELVTVGQDGVLREVQVESLRGLVGAKAA